MVLDNAYEFYHFTHDKPELLTNPVFKQLINWIDELRGGNCQCDSRDRSLQVGELYSRIAEWLTPENQIYMKGLFGEEKIYIKHMNSELIIF